MSKQQQPQDWAEYGGNPIDDLEAVFEEVRQGSQRPPAPNMIVMGPGPYGIIRFPSDMMQLCKAVQQRIPMGVHFKALCIGPRSSGRWRGWMLKLGLWLLKKACVEIYTEKKFGGME